MKKKLVSLALATILCVSLIVPSFAAKTYTPVWLGKGVTLEDSPYFSAPLTAVRKDGKWGYTNRLGQITIAPQYEYALPFSEGLAAVGKGGKSGFINTAGKVVIPLQYEDAASFSEGLAAVCKDGKYGFIDKTGKLVIPNQYEYVYAFNGGLAVVSANKKWGFIDKTGKAIATPQYDGCYNFTAEGLALVHKDGKWGYIDKSGKEAIALQYERAVPFADGLAAVRKGGKWGYIDKTGKTVVSPKYTYAGGFSEGLAVVANAGKYGYIDKTGKVAAAATYEQASDFSGGLAAVKKGGKWGFIDKTGKVVVPLEYDLALEFTQDTAIVRKGGQYALLNITVGGFTDVLFSSDYAQAIDWAVEKKITKGTSTKPPRFSPDEKCTTAQILTFLWRAKGEPELASAANPFTGIKESDYFYKAVRWAGEKGLVSAQGFDPEAPCTRATAVTYLWKLAGSPTAQSSGFDDVPAAADYAQAVAWAVEKKVTKGTGGNKFSPNNTCTRGQIMTFLYRDLV